MPEVVLQGPWGWIGNGILAASPQSLDKPVETDGADWPAALGNEHVGVYRVIAA